MGREGRNGAGPRANQAWRLWIALGLVLSVAVGCESDDGGAGGPGGSGDSDVLEDGLVVLTGACSDFPLRQEAEADWSAEVATFMVSVGEEAFTPLPAQTRYRFAGTSFFDYEHVKAHNEVGGIYASWEELQQAQGVSNFSTLADDLEVDWETESVLLMLGFTGQHAYRYGVAGDQLTVYAGHLLPCDEVPEEDWAFYYGDDVLFLRVPKVKTLRFEQRDLRYRFVEVLAGSDCERDPVQPVISRSGGVPFVLSERWLFRGTPDPERRPGDLV